MLGMERDCGINADFQIEQQIVEAKDRASVVQKMKNTQNGVYPALVDATVLTWSLGLKLGDTLHYEGEHETIAVVLAGMLSNSIFQGNIVIDKELFNRAWPQITGSELFLAKTTEQETASCHQLLSQALHEYGVRVNTTNSRMKQFYTVTDTYLTIFMTLGSIGMLLGIICFIIIIRKNMIKRNKEIAVYTIIGYDDKQIEELLYREAIFVPLFAVFSGVLCACIGVSFSVQNISMGVWLLLCITVAIFTTTILWFIRSTVRKNIQRTKKQDINS